MAARDGVDRVIPLQPQTERLRLRGGDPQGRGHVVIELAHAEGDLLDETDFPAPAEDHGRVPVSNVDEDDRSLPVLLAAHHPLEGAEQRARRRIHGGGREPRFLQQPDVRFDGGMIHGEQDVFVLDLVALPHAARQNVVDGVPGRVQVEALRRLPAQDLIGLVRLVFRQAQRRDPDLVDGQRRDDLASPELSVGQQLLNGPDDDAVPLLGVALHGDLAGRQHLHPAVADGQLHHLQAAVAEVQTDGLDLVVRRYPIRCQHSRNDSTQFEMTDT